jgi:2-polyprenyl-3-methyl-5-hydroxy-6-metoxy-1,4-benzoquinol methylase
MAPALVPSELRSSLAPRVGISQYWPIMTPNSSQSTEPTPAAVGPTQEERTRRVLVPVDTSGLGLEIGPSYNPLLPKRSGANIEILDHASRDELVAKYRELGLTAEELDRIEDVDYVSTGAGFVDAIGRTGVFDFIIGSNVVEHMVDFVRFLQDCDALLKPGGRVSVTVPDMRFCFDLLRPVSSISSVLDAHLTPTRFHTPGTLFEAASYMCARDGKIAWSPDETGTVALQLDVADGKNLVRQSRDQLEYHDAHRWTFTPSSFVLLLQDLRELGYHSLVQYDSEPPIGFEFFVTLGHADGPPQHLDRLQLMQQIRSELAAVAEQDGLGPRAVELQETLAAARRDLAASRGELESLRRELDGTRELLDGVVSSRSWQITRPLRRVASALRRH